MQRRVSSGACQGQKERQVPSSVARSSSFPNQMTAYFQHMEKLMRPALMFARCVSLTAAIKLSFGEIHLCIVQPAVANYSQQR